MRGLRVVQGQDKFSALKARLFALGAPKREVNMCFDEEDLMALLEKYNTSPPTASRGDPAAMSESKLKKASHLDLHTNLAIVRLISPCCRASWSWACLCAISTSAWTR